MLEGSFILNIIVLIILSIIVTNVAQEDKYHKIIIFYVSIGTAFVTFLGILACHIWHRLNLKWQYRKYFKSYFIKSFNFLSKSNHQCMSKDNDIGKPGGNASTTMDFGIRELLLDDTTTEL